MGRKKTLISIYVKKYRTAFDKVVQIKEKKWPTKKSAWF